MKAPAEVSAERDILAATVSVAPVARGSRYA